MRKIDIAQEEITMALIECPECGGKVSDKATVCIHCGFPLINNQAEKETATQSEVRNISQSNTSDRTQGFTIFSIDKSHVNLECKNCSKIYKFFISTNFSKVSETECILSDNIRCPHCGNIAEKGSKIFPKVSKTNQEFKCSANQTNATEKKGMSGCSSFIATIVVLLIIGWFLNMASCGGGSGDRTCAWCNGTGYNGNGAKNATEYVFKKTPCTHCDGTGTY